LHRSKTSWQEHLRIEFFLDEALPFEIQKINRLRLGLQEIKRIEAFVSVLLDQRFLTVSWRVWQALRDGWLLLLLQV